MSTDVHLEKMFGRAITRERDTNGLLDPEIQPTYRLQVGDESLPFKQPTKLKKRILFLAPRFPYPPLSGDKLFLLNAARALRDHHLSLICFCASDEEMKACPNDGLFESIHRIRLSKRKSYVKVLISILGSMPLQLAYYDFQEFRERVEELLPRHDAVIAHLIRCGQFIANRKVTVPRILMMADAISLTYERMSSLSGSSLLWHYLYRIEQSRLLNYEKSCPKHFDQMWIHSEIDRDYLGLDPSRARIVPVGIDLEEFPFKAESAGNIIAFIGNLSYSVNRDACLHFIRFILPELRKDDEVRLRVIGACPEKVRREFEHHQGVEVTGTVERIADTVENVFCGICPIRAGAGIQNKILNYLALGIPCVTSTVGLEGLEAVAGTDLLVYETNDEAVAMVRSLHKNAALRSLLAMNGRKLVERKHDWKMIHEGIRASLNEALGVAD